MNSKSEKPVIVIGGNNQFRQAVALERIADVLEKLASQADPQQVETQLIVDESMGSCPGCDAVNEVTTCGSYPQVIYKCGGCNTMWVNDEQSFFGS